MNATLNRREFLKESAVLAGGLMISFDVPLKKTPEVTTFSPNAFLHIAQDDTITVILSKVEMGQGIWTTLAMLIAEELDCDLNKVQIRHSPVSSEYDHIFLGRQATVGSSSTYTEFDRYRYAGATARAILIQAAATRFSVSPDECTTETGFVVCRGRRIRYGELVKEASKLPTPAVKLREPKDWKIIGRSHVRLDGAEKVDGSAKYGIDIQLPNLLTAVVLHPPVFGGKVISVNATKAMNVRGVRQVVKIPSGVAVLAVHYWAATRGRDELEVEWELPSGTDTDTLFDHYKELSVTSGMPALRRGDVSTALGKSEKIFEADYSLPYLAHAPMEPLNCVVKIEDDQCEIWTGTQLPTGDRQAVASVLNFKPENVRITTPFLGGSFGRRGSLNSDWIVEATHIARVSGKAIKMIWSREDDMRAGCYRPAYFHRVQVGLSKSSRPQCWQHRVVGQSVFKTVTDEIDGSSVEGIVNSPYVEHAADVSVELHATTCEVPVLPWRSVGFSQTCFVMESVIDELAHMAGIDPVEYRRSLLKDHTRYLGVMNLAAEKSGWDEAPPPGRFRGIAVNHSHRSYVAQVVELSVDNLRIRVHRVICAIDCGLAVNPDGIRAQLESAVVFALTAALYGEITLDRGVVRQKNFDDYRMLRMNQMPEVEVYILESTNEMGGAGEPGVPPVAPALVNALFAATGKRFRKLPIKNL